MRGNEGIDIAVRDARVSNHAEQSAYGMCIARGHQYTTQYAVYRGVPHVDDFIGLHLEHFITFRNGIAL